MSYKPGLHILIGIYSANTDKFKNEREWQAFIEHQINSFNLSLLGKVAHSFGEEAGFTSVHCLTESHISMHTWPEYNYCTCDVFLSNYLKYNNDIAKKIGQNIVNYFESHNYELKEVIR